MPKDNTAQYVILGLLSHEDLSGYDIKKRVELSISHFWPLSYGQLYPTLSRLERESMVAKRAAINTKGPPRSLYSITDTGKKRLRDWLFLPAQKETTRFELLLKLFFGGGLPPEENIGKIRDFREGQEKNLALMQLYEKELSSVLKQSPDHLNYYLTVLFGKSVYTAYVSWARQAEELLTSHGIKEDKVER